MAAVTATDRTHHGTLVAGSADKVTFPLNYRSVTVRNRATSGVLYARVDGVDAVVGADGTFAVPAGQSTLLVSRIAPNEPSDGVVNQLVVSIISATADPYDLEA